MAIYDYSSGGFPTSPVTDDTLAMKGTTYKYNGSAWEVQTGGTTSFTYTATSGQTAFTGADTGSKTLAYTAASLHVFLNGILLDAADYTATDGTTVTLAVGATTGDELQVVAYGVLVGSGGGGAWEVISSQTVTTAVSSVELTGLDSTYGKHVVHFSGGTVSDDLWNIKYGSAASYATSATDYQHIRHYYGGLHGSASHTSTTKHILQMVTGVSATLDIHITGLGTANTVFTSCTDQSTRAAGAMYGGQMQGLYANTPASAIDRLTLYSEGGANISSGTIITVYGIKTS